MALTLAIGITNSVLDASNVQTVYPPINLTDTTSIVALALEDFQVPNLTVDQAIGLNGLTCRYVVIRASGVISVKVNGTGNTAQTGTLFVLGGGSVTSLHVSNSSGQVAICDIRAFS